MDKVEELRTQGEMCYLAENKGHLHLNAFNNGAYLAIFFIICLLVPTKAQNELARPFDTSENPLASDNFNIVDDLNQTVAPISVAPVTIPPIARLPVAVDALDPEQIRPTISPQNAMPSKSQEIKGILTSLPKIEALRAESINFRREGNVGVIKDDGKEIGICHIASFLPFTSKGIPWGGGSSYESAASLALAAHHLNTGNGSIAMEVEGLNKRCNVRFTVEFQDTALKENIAVDGVIKATDRSKENRTLPLPCAFAGAYRSAVSIPTSTITGLRGFPQLSALSTSQDLDNTAQFPLFGRTIPSDSGTAFAVVRHLHYDLGVKYLAVLHINDSYGNAYALGMQNAAKKIAPSMRMLTVEFPVTMKEIDAKRVIRELKETQYTFFFGLIYPTDNFELLMTEAYYQGIAGTGHHNWLFGDATGNDVTRIPFEAESPLVYALQGTGLIAASAGVSGYNAFDTLSESLASLNNPSDITYLENKFREFVFTDAAVGKVPFLNNPNFGSSPGIMGPFMYDVGILIGLSACAAVNATNYFDGVAHFNEMLNKSNSFEGASGDVILDDVTGTRTPESALFTLLNFVHDDDLSNESYIQYKAVESRLFTNGTWSTLRPFVFNDGTTSTPSDLPELKTERNYINSILRFIGLAMCAITISLSFGFSIWTYIRRESYVVKASQPIFLHLICVGSAVLGAAIIPLGIDMGVAGQELSDKACRSFPWFVSIGSVIVFSALFTKTHRLNKLYSNTFKRMKVTAFDVAKPMIALIAVDILILALWTKYAPLRRRSTTLELDTFGRRTETFSYCYSDNQAPYLVSLCFVNLGVVIYSVYEACKARKITTEFAESEYIFMAMTLILLVFFMGIPVLIIASENTNAFFFVFSGIIFTTCLSILLLIFVPKVQHRNVKRRRTSVTGVKNTTMNQKSALEEDQENLVIASSALEGLEEIEEESTQQQNHSKIDSATGL